MVTATKQSIPQSVLASLEKWKHALLDMTKRNQALNFRQRKASTILVVDEQPPEVFRRLYTDGESMGFLPANEDSEAGPSSGMAREPGVAQPSNAGTWDFTPYDRAALPEQHTDPWLQTKLSNADLAKNLRRIDDLARGSLEEQGVNTLFLALGMLHYRESDDSDQMFCAPVVLLPVRLLRAAANAELEIAAADDDVVVNPTLAEYLRRTWRIELPAWSDTDPTGAEIDLQTLFTQVSERIRGRTGWRLTNEIVLGLFSFEKLVMFKDLEASAVAIGSHPVVQQLVTRQGGQAGLGLPPDVRSASLDEAIPPEHSAHLVPADGSQLRALLAVARGHSLVIEGPPGTGKSQTITNLVAQSLKAGKSVLFVAEKRAALDVVHARLQASGLSEFCLALHSPDASRRQIFEGMKTAIDVSAEAHSTSNEVARRLPTVRSVLTEYAGAVHTKRAPIGASVYDGFSRIAEHAAVPLVPWEGDVGRVTRDQLELALRAAQDLSRAAEPIGDPTRHPYRDVGRTSFSELVLQELAQIGAELDRRLARFDEIAKHVAATLGLPMADTFAWLPHLQGAADVMGRSPGAPIEVLHDPAWAAVPPQAHRLMQEVAELQTLHAASMQRFSADAFSADHTADIAHVRSKKGVAALFSWLDGRYKNIRRRWESLRQPGYAPTIGEQAAHLEELEQLKRCVKALEAKEWEGRSHFGWSWRGVQSSVPGLQAYAQWVTEFRALATTIQLGASAFATASAGPADVSAVTELVGVAAASRELLSRFIERLQLPNGYFDNQPITVIRARVAELVGGAEHAPAWAAFEAARREAAGSVAAPLVRRGLIGEIPLAKLPTTIARSFWSRWVNEVVDRDPTLAGFQGLVHDERVLEFRDLDQRVLQENRSELVRELRARLQRRLLEPAIAQQMSTLRPEIVKQKRHKPLRKTLFAAADAARAIHPCWLMSPLSVSQFTQVGELPPFDLVVFDEASQMRPEDAICAISRGRQLVVVGDPKQLPPTNFFGAQIEDNTEDADDDHPDADSILEVAGGAGLPSTRLKWHYRSAHESLIAFSNERFYDAELRTFPSIERISPSAGLTFELVENGIYEGSGRNRVEAERVADSVLAFAREQMRKPARERWSLGVGTFNLRQRLEVDDILFERRKLEPGLDEFFDKDREDPFFIKNLESIQGDERDAIFLSITYGRGADGQFRQNFGPLNKEGGWRRLNVITTRARRVMRVFSSIRATDIQEGRAKIGPLLKGFLAYAETGRLDGGTTDRRALAESPFEREVGDELERRGYKVVAQVGECGYRIDLAVCDPEENDRYVVGIECDGVAYHASETARDRDRLREEVLRTRGWTILRVWSTDWFKAKAAQISRLVAAIEAAKKAPRTRPLEQVAAFEPAPAVADAPTARSPKPAPGPSRSSGSQPGEVRLRPVAEPYRMAPGYRSAAQALIDTPLSMVADGLAHVVQHEGPIHEDELVTRVATLWGHQRSGARIREHVLRASQSAQHAGRVERRGAFFWLPGSTCVPRVRTDGAPTEPERIAPEEYEAAVRIVLASGDVLARERLLAEVRSLFGFQRTGRNLESRIGERVDALRSRGELVEVSEGIRLAASAQQAIGNR